MGTNASDLLTIHCLGSERAVRFAAKELARYLRVMTGDAVKVSTAKTYAPESGGIWVGVSSRFADSQDSAPETDIFHDDVHIDATPKQVIIGGANPRSVVYSAYRYLEELGCRWFRPGRNGESVPNITNPFKRRFVIHETPSARHRCICIEGSCSIEHVTNMIDYAVKRGFNAYMLQFRNSHAFFDEWYSRERYRGKGGPRLTLAEADKLWDKAKKQALTRGMVLHTVGHGWTCEPLGIPGFGWDRYEGPELPDSIKQYFAEVNGKREMYWNIPTCTNLCYSNPKARTLMAEEVVRYATARPDEQVIHVWLADGANNQCECPECRKARPSDFFIDMLNEIDARMTEQGLRTRIVFLAYVDLLWPPQKARLANPSRFILNFCPITRSYSNAFLENTPTQKKPIPPFRRNKLRFPETPVENIAFLDAWRRVFKGEYVDFDYHLWMNPHRDLTHMQTSRILHRDLADLKKLGMDGFISCQIQRVCLPTGIAMHVMGKTLWDAQTPYDRTVDTYFADLFGREGGKARGYLERLANLLDAKFLRGEKQGEEALGKAVRNWRKVAPLVDSMQPLFAKGIRSKEPFRVAAWENLRIHGWYASACAHFFGQVYRKDLAANATYREIVAEMRRLLPRIHDVFDTKRAQDNLERLLNEHGIPKEPDAQESTGPFVPQQ